MATRNYTSLYQIKDFLINQIAPKYLSDDEMNMSQIGLFGYITEALSTLGEDGLNATSMVFKECFANAAENIESLYLMAAIYQLEQLFATPASMPFIIIVEEDEIISRSNSSGGILSFYLDKNTQFKINDLTYTLEYDIRINSKKTKNGYNHTAQYVIDHEITLSKMTSPYIRTKTIQYNNENFICLLVDLRQMLSEEHEETIISNDNINIVSFDYDLGSTTQIAGFEAYYTAASSTAKEVQLVKKLENTNKLTQPFCFYTMPDEGVLRISFSNDERFFVPEFNSKLRVVIYTTSGEEGNFAQYSDTDINVITTSKRYTSNNGLILMGQCHGDSAGGKDILTFDEFRNAVITAQSTVNAFSTANDLELFFKNLTEAGNSKIMFMKRRDDALIRLFNAFVLLTDSNNVVLPTNTTTIMVEEDEIDADYPETYRSIIKAGRIYKYSTVEAFDGALQVDDSIKITDDLDEHEDEFLYTNPFLMILSSRPVNIGLYMNSVDDALNLDANYVNQDSFVQFMVSSLKVKRNALLGENDYKFEIRLLPTSEVTECVTEVKEDTLVPDGTRTFVNSVDGATYMDNQKIVVMLAFEDSGSEVAYQLLELTSYDRENGYYNFTGSITTDDYVSTNNKARIIKGLKSTVDSSDMSEVYLPCTGMVVNVYTFYKHTDMDNIVHSYENIGVAKGMTLTNIYKAKAEKMDLIVPMNMIRAFLSYNQYTNLEGELTYNYRIASIPMVKANYVKNASRFKTFVQMFTNIYNYLNAEIDRLTNNFDIDIKFYNTYGRSKNYTVGTDDTQQDLYRTNIKLKFGVKPYYTTDTENLIADLKEYILNYLRTGFDSQGNNSLYISNLIKSIETDYADKVEYLIYKGIDDYPLEIQKVEPKINSENLAEYYSTMLEYVPEYINVYYKFHGDKYEPEVQLDVIS